MAAALWRIGSDSVGLDELAICLGAADIVKVRIGFNLIPAIVAFLNRCFQPMQRIANPFLACVHAGDIIRDIHFGSN